MEFGDPVASLLRGWCMRTLDRRLTGRFHVGLERPELAEAVWKRVLHSRLGGFVGWRPSAMDNRAAALRERLGTHLFAGIEGRA